MFNHAWEFLFLLKREPIVLGGHIIFSGDWSSLSESICRLVLLPLLEAVPHVIPRTLLDAVLLFLLS